MFFLLGQPSIYWAAHYNFTAFPAYKSNLAYFPTLVGSINTESTQRPPLV